MKKIMSLVVVLCVSTLGFTQGLYVKVGGGYAVPMGSQTLLEPYQSEIVTGNFTEVTTTTSVVKGSYGAGTVFNAAVGFKFSPFIGFDLNLAYQLGQEFSGTTSAESPTVFANLEEKTQSQGFYAAPALMFMAGSESVRPYALVGVIAGKVDLVTERTGFYDFTDIPFGTTEREETKGEMAFGFRGGMGVDINVGDRISIYAEGIFNSISYYAKESEITEATLDGEDYLPEYSVSDRKTIYVETVTTVTVDDIPQVDPDQPTQALRSPSPLSSLGINVGVKIKLGSD